MKKLTVVFIALLFSMGFTFAQKGKKDVVYLKNGSIVNGQIISSLPSGQVKLQTKDNSLWVFEKNQIDSISRTTKKSKQFRSGFFNLTEVGVLAGNSDNKYALPFSFMNISGFQIKNRLSLGVGAGVEFFSETYLPVVGDLRYYFSRKGVSPFIGIQGGYSFALDKPDKQYVYQNYDIWPGPSGNTVDVEADGGLMLNPSVGFCTSIGDNLSLMFSAGYRMMRHSYERDDKNKIDIDYNRLSLKIGLIFQ